MKKAPVNTPARYLQDALGSDSLEALEAIQRLRARLDEAEQYAVFKLRLQGSTWQEIADATGCASRQAAQQRWKDAELIDRLGRAVGREVKP